VDVVFYCVFVPKNKGFWKSVQIGVYKFSGGASVFSDLKEAVPKLKQRAFTQVYLTLVMPFI